MASSHNFVSPLRYPGGKARIAAFIEDIILINNLENGTIYELYAGGAGASLNILLSGLCKKIVLNDLDYHIYAFWYAILNHTEEFIKLIDTVKVDIENWHIQVNVYENFKEFSIIEVGFSTFFLNRTNRSGILYKAGPIGGKAQNGNFKIDVRFNKNDLINRIEKIAQNRNKIVLSNIETKELLQDIFSEQQKNNFIFLDPPYYKQGENLYLSFYKDSDHVELQEILTKNNNSNWFLTYDNCFRINELYKNFRKSYLPMSYTLQSKRKSKEIMVFSDNLYLPKRLKIGAKSISYNLTEELI